MSWLEPGLLQGERVRLEPLGLQHVDALEEAARESDLSTLWYTSAPSAEDVRAMVESRLDKQDRGEWAPYAVLTAEGSRALGMTGYLNIPSLARRPEIGGTWMRLSSHRTGANVEAKLLLLTQAFEILRCTAVEFRTHRFNRQSRQALEALGAQLDGILRAHFDPFGRPRDTCVYSIVGSEWGDVKRHLEWRLSRRRTSHVPHEA